MWDFLGMTFDKGFGAYVVILSTLSGFLFGLAYKHKNFVTKNILAITTYTKEEIDHKIVESEKKLVSEKILDSKLETLKNKLDTMDQNNTKMDERNKERNETVTMAIEKVDQAVRDTILKVDKLLSKMIKL